MKKITQRERKQQANYTLTGNEQKNCASCCFLNEDALFDKLDHANNPTDCGRWGVKPNPAKGWCPTWEKSSLVRAQIAQHARKGYWSETGRFEKEIK